jgi:hypothetical protein
MFKLKLLVGFAGLMTALVVLAAPAMAEFESTTGKSQGAIKTFPTTTTFESVESGPAVTCKSTNGEGTKVAEGGWQIQVKSTTAQGKFFTQAATLKGPHEQLKITKWGVCTGPTGIAAAVECNLQVESNGTNSSGTGSVYPPGCVVKIGTGANTCTITVQPDGNKELQGTTLENITGGVSIKASTKGVTSTIQESMTLCKTLGVKGGQKAGKYSLASALETEGQKLV